MKYVFGPVPFRKLARSLGINPILPKTCNFSCVYCQLGRTTNFTNERMMFFLEEIIKEVKIVIEIEKKIDFITIAGDGEPTLYFGLSTYEGIIKISSISIAIITNGALLYQEDVRTDFLDADIVKPAFVALNEIFFRTIDRPHKDITLEKLIKGLKIFRIEYKDEILLKAI
ncbi:MAG: radical SAM protein [Asgard group archaeon]|nr:radical SAM protein [Asgard group archaeon]